MVSRPITGSSPWEGAPLPLPSPGQRARGAGGSEAQARGAPSAEAARNPERGNRQPPGGGMGGSVAATSEVSPIGVCGAEGRSGGCSCGGARRRPGLSFFDAAVPADRGSPLRITERG